MAQKQPPNKKDSPVYLIATPIEELIDDGIVFEGETEKDCALNMFDFCRLREVIQRFSQNLTTDMTDTLMRSLKCCVKTEKD